MRNNIQLPPEELLLIELVEKLGKVSPLFTEERNLKPVLEIIDEYVEELIKLKKI